MSKVIIDAIGGPMAGRQWEFAEPDAWVVGRGPDCHAQLDVSDQTVSRHHFLLEVRPPELRVRDHGSRNGTFVNDEKIGGRSKSESVEVGRRRVYPEREVGHGDELRVGANRFRVRVEGASDEHPSTVSCQRCGSGVRRWVHRASVAALCDRCLERDAHDPLALLERAIHRQVEPAPDTARDLAAPTLEGERSNKLPSIDGLEVLRKLGEGGTGAVYEARDRAGRRVAVKVLLSRVAVDAGMRAMFLREIEALGDVQHERIVRLLSSGSTGASFYFVMELCGGGSLASSVGRSGAVMEPPRAVSLMCDALEGLGYAHRRGLVHRDVKPGNILIDDAGRGKISDFGLAKSFERAGLSGFTMTGSFAGTFEFMPREQLTHYRSVRPTSDVYSAGATLYWALTRKTVIDFSRDVDRVTALLQSEPVPIARRVVGLDPRLCAIVDKACAMDPRERYEDASAMLTALRGL
jgi:hypothetical protein